LRSLTRRIEYGSRADEFHLYLIADPHLGSKHSNEKLLREIVKKIDADPFAYWIGMGDYCDFINLEDPRFDPRELAKWLLGADELSDIGRAESARFIDMLAPVRDRCLALIAGNHEESILRHSDHDVYARIIDGMANGHKLRLNHSGFLSLRFQRRGGSVWTLRMYLTHGSGGGQSGGNTGNKLQKLVAGVDGVQLVAMGHHHDPDYKQFARLRASRDGVHTVMIHAISCPALIGHMIYAQTKDYRPRPTGYAMVTVVPDKRHISVAMCG